MIEWKAQEYADIASLQTWLAESRLAELQWRGDERVLDVGCGDGRVTATMAARVPRGQVCGVDVSHDMIAFAQRTHTAPNLDFAVCDALELSRLEGACDRITSFNALHWVQDHARVLRDMHGLLVDGGDAILQMVGHGERKSLEHVIRETCVDAAWHGWLAAYARPYSHVAPDIYRDMAHRAGFRGEVTLEPCQWDFGSRAAFLKWAQATFQYWTKHLPPASVDAFIHAVLDAYRAVGDGSPADADVFHFYQMKATLRKTAG